MTDRENTSLWKRFRGFFGEKEEANTPAGRAPVAEANISENETEEAPSPADDASSFSALNLRDRVVVMLLFDQVVHIEQVSAAWHHWNDDSMDTPDTLWRVVALLPGVDREAVYAQAARVYAFEPVDFNMYGARALLRKRRRAFTRSQWQRMVDLNVAPVSTEYDEEKDATCWVFATHDPARPAVQRLLAELSVPSHVLRYAPREPLEEVFDEALPRLAKERAVQPLLPDLTEKAAAQMPSGFMAKFAHGPSFDTDAPHETDEGSGGEAAASLETRQKGAQGSSDPSGRLPPARLFDEVLAGIVQAGARAAYLFGNARGQLEVYHQRRRSFQHWRTEAHVPAEAMIDFVSGRILSLRPAREQSEEAVERWVEHRRVAFRPSIESAGDLPEALPAQADAEVVVIEVLR